MSLIEIKRIQANVDALKERIEAMEDALKELKTVPAPVEETAKGLEDKFNAMTVDLEDKINASVKATVEASVDVIKTELKAFAKTLVPVGGRKKSSTPEEAQE